MANEKRLIDANALLLVIEEELAHESPFFTHEQNEMIDCGLRIAAKDIRHQPPVDAVEVVHGRWVDEYPYVRCSECNAEWINCRTDNEPKLFYYCPNCGADMRERKDNERKAD